MFDGIPNVPLGNAQLSLSGAADCPDGACVANLCQGGENDGNPCEPDPQCNLVVSNIGSSGLDGVRQPLAPGTTRMVSGIACPNFAESLAGTEARFQMFGDVPGELISELRVRNTDGETIEARADFSPVGVTDYTVQIMIGDHMVANLTGLPEAVVFFPRTDLNEIDCFPIPGTNLIHISYELTWVSPILVPGHGTFNGNVIWVIGRVDDPTRIPTGLTRIDNFFKDTGPVEMTFQYAGPGTPPDVCGPSPENSDCCDDQLTPGCADETGCVCVCDTAPECCLVQWDARCVALYQSLGCGACDPPGSACLSDAECDDADDCTVDRCCLGLCEHEEIPGCRCPPVDPPDPETPPIEKTRYITVVPTNPGRLTALEVTFDSLAGAYNTWNGRRMWVNTPKVFTELSGLDDPVPPPSFLASNLVCDPVCLDWGAGGQIDVYAEGVLPGSSYSVRAIDCRCDLADRANYSAPVTVTTSKFGDLTRPFAVVWPPPDGVVDIAFDLVAVVAKFVNDPDAPRKVRADLRGDLVRRCVDMKISVLEFLTVIDAFTGFLYPDRPSNPDPCTGPCPAAGP